MMVERALTGRQANALVEVARGRASSYNKRSCPSLVRRGLVRDCGHRRLVRWEITEAGRKVVEEIMADRLERLRAGTL